MVIHLAMFDAVAVTGHHSKRLVEYVDHLHEHFVEPTVVKAGAYRAPIKPGSSAQMHDSSIEEFLFPNGKYWSHELQGNEARL
jgi:L-fuconate dehydratase